jgi:hypothetical protein
MEFFGRFYDSVHSNFAGRKMVRERERDTTVVHKLTTMC